MISRHIILEIGGTCKSGKCVIIECIRPVVYAITRDGPLHGGNIAAV